MALHYLLSVCLVLAVSQAVPHGSRGSLGMFGGKNVSISDYPYMVSVLLEDTYISVGVILNEHWILTAANNIDQLGNMTVRAGSTLWDKGGQEYNITKMVFHDDWYLWNDNLGLLRTLQTIKFGDDVKPITLATKELKVGQTGKVTGWGMINPPYNYTEILMEADATLVDLKVCKAVYDHPTPTSKQLCTNDQNSGPDMLDDGLPLVMDGELYGMFSGAYLGLPEDRPCVWTNIPKYRKWILKHTKK